MFVVESDELVIVTNNPPKCLRKNLRFPTTPVARKVLRICVFQSYNKLTFGHVYDTETLSKAYDFGIFSHWQYDVM